MSCKAGELVVGRGGGWVNGRRRRCRTYAEGGEGVGTDFETAFVNPLEEFPEYAFCSLFRSYVDLVQTHSLFARLRFIVEYHCCDRVVLECLSQNRAAWHCALRIIVAATQLDDDLRPLQDEIRYGGRVWSCRVCRLKA